MSGTKILFNLSATQPIHNAKFHGGGSYGEVLFLALVKALAKKKEVENLFGIYDGKKILSDSVLNVCQTNGIFLFDKNKISPQEVIDQKKIDTFYTPLYSLDKIWDLRVKNFIFTWHGLRALEMRYSFSGVRFAQKIPRKLEALIRYRNSWKRYFYRPKYQKLAAQLLNEKGFYAITVSEHSLASIHSFFPELLHKEIPVFYSPMIEFSPEGKLPLGIETEKYFLLTSGARWEKNNLRAAKAFDEVIEIYRRIKKPFDFKMIITGVSNKKVYTRSLRHLEHFVLLQYVENEALEFLHQNAYAFIFPSLNEGFGYPPVQSMRYGVPVAASGTTSIPEICGDAAIYFDPYSTSEMRNRMLQLLNPAIYSDYALRAKKRYLEVHKRQESDLQKAVQFILEKS